MKAHLPPSMRDLSISSSWRILIATTNLLLVFFPDLLRAYRVRIDPGGHKLDLSYAYYKGPAG